MIGVQKIIAILILKVGVISAAWSPPYLSDVHEKVDVSYENRSASAITITIAMDEEIPTPFDIGTLAGYLGSSSPSIASFITGSNSNLGLEFGGNWKMILTRTQDYENSIMQRGYHLVLAPIDGITADVIVQIRNIFDNFPTIKLLNETCEVNENEAPGFDSGCIFEVNDRDGMTNNSIKFVLGSHNDLFEFREVAGSVTDYTVKYTLIVKETLDYTLAVSYIFAVDLSDAGDNVTPFNVIVQVKNMPLRPPIWIRPFASETFLEKTNQTFEVNAIDGDRGINADICYELEFETNNDYGDLISINTTSGVINVQPINRDAFQKEIFSFGIIAYECENRSSSISSAAVFIVQDVNDNHPLIDFDSSKNLIKIWESELSTLFESSELSVNDIDLGDHATYSVSLLPEFYARALRIIPGFGYQKQNFTISVGDPFLLDYENDPWRNFNMTIYSEETVTEEKFNDSKVFQVELLNWNDELPIFELEEYEFEVNETIGPNEVIGFIKANDRDIDDFVVYYLNGKINETISLNNETGELRTMNNLRTFDYETQTDVYFQAFAHDTLQTRNESLHTTFTQIHIIVLDINDTPPQIKLPPGILRVRENDRNWTYTIEAFDPDTTADLEFFILWDDSSVSGPNTTEEFYLNSLIIELDPVTNINHVTGTLKVNPDFLYEIDYEKFHFMYIMIGVRDKNTVVNDDTAYAILTIEIEDENDNPPEFVGYTLTVTRRVVEESEEGIYIGIIRAIDVDGPGNNEIEYQMIPRNPETPDGWLSIDDKTGDILVSSNGEISCDKPNERITLDYTVILFDGVWTTQGNVSIQIIDINNKVPQINESTTIFSQNQSYFELYENATDVDITSIIAHDNDRDAPHHILFYSIDEFLTANFFEINSVSGELRVRNLTDSVPMDRDNGITEHIIYINVHDNNRTGIPLSNSTTITLKLLDCNDNSPEMTEISPRIQESLSAGGEVIEFYAPDKDEGLNAQVDYRIELIENVEFYGNDAPTNFENLFTISNIDDFRASIKAGINLRGYSGVWSVLIVARDRGEQGDAGVSLESNKTYQFTIEPVNFEAPRIVFPPANHRIAADLEQARVGFPLRLLDGSDLRPFEAFDPDAGDGGVVTFKTDAANEEFFEFRFLNKSHSELILKKAVEETSYVLTLTAIDGGSPPLSSPSVDNIRINFINRTSEPIYEISEFSTNFTEGEEGLNEVRILPVATDLKNSGDITFEIYYFIDYTYNPLDAQFFLLDKITRELTLNQTLDREAVDSHQIQIIATNSVNMPPPAQVSENSKLIVNIKVNDINDNAPKFDQEKYEVGISESDNLNKILLTLSATDLDLNDVVTFYILSDTMTVSNEGLEPYKENAFLLDARSGILILNFEVQESLSGHFKFEVEARDLVNHTDRAFVTVYVISESSRFSFLFINTTAEVNGVDQEKLIDILSNQYQAECIKDDILPFKNDEGVASDTMTVLRAHFMKDGDVVNASYINSYGVIPSFLQQTQIRFLTELGLNLDSVPKEVSSEVEPAQILELVLAIMSGILGVLLIAMIAFHIIQMRNYNRQIKALSQSSFDPSAFNAKKLPTQNLHAEEKSNPVMNADFVNLDTKSIISEESDDFAGLENSHIFDMKTDEKPKNPLSNGVESPRRDSSTYA